VSLILLSIGHNDDKCGEQEEALQKYMEQTFDHESVRLTNADNVRL
jgi:hypothetical protein